MTGNALKKEILDWAIHILIALIIAFLIVNFVAQRTIVFNYSMEPTLKEGDNLLVEKISPRLKKFNYGDIVTIDAPETVGEERSPIIKRIIALENDTVEIKDGKVYVNGEAIKEPYIKGSYTQEQNPEYSKMTVPKGMVYVLGDNREALIVDSRTMGAIDMDKITGKAIFRFYPFSKFGSLK
ncbi:signal peptidase I [Pseudoclostridium thermosuccinogenes]|jgi:signal peptidase I|uniref:signal peptidase I n=1 Tax=Clostridium thermosuccinogenes TaxID=84032 RepID=UPI001FA87D25|nr:signal peptidase I [Pseudoclostridium thermosuccinogenes]